MEAPELQETLELQEITALLEDLCQDLRDPWEDQVPKDQTAHEDRLDPQVLADSREFKDPLDPTSESKTAPEEPKDPKESLVSQAQPLTTSSSTPTLLPSTHRGTWLPNVWTA